MARSKPGGNYAKDHDGSGSIGDSAVGGNGGHHWSFWHRRSIISGDMRQGLRIAYRDRAFQGV
jgi:hypothetical protein